MWSWVTAQMKMHQLAVIKREADTMRALLREWLQRSFTVFRKRDPMPSAARRRAMKTKDQIMRCARIS